MKLKVCGMKYIDNINEVAALQPDYLGFIFYDKSKRQFVENTIPQLPDAIKKVGVFVDETLDTVIETIRHYQLQAVQLHGSESVDFCKQLKGHLEFISESSKGNLKQVQMDTKIEIIKAFSMNDRFDFEVLKPYETVCDYFLFDTKGTLPGGNGYTFNWKVLNQYPLTKPFFLSGGIGLNEMENLSLFQGTVGATYCYAVDVNSQFETAPGQKNTEHLKEFKDKVITKTETTR